MKIFFRDLKREKLLMAFIAIAVIMLCSYLFISTVFMYSDTTWLSAWPIYFWDALFGDGLKSFNILSVEDAYGFEMGVFSGSFLSFIHFIIWEFPVWIAIKLIPGFAAHKYGIGLWNKLFLVLCLIALCIFVYKIVSELTNNDVLCSFLSVALILGDLCILDSIAYAGQDEIAYLLAIILSLYLINKGKKVAFVVLGAYIVTAFPVMCIFWLAIELVYEKKFWNIIWKSAVTFIPMVLFEFYYRNDVLYQDRKAFNYDIFQQIFTSGVWSYTIGIGAIGITLICLVLFFLYNNSDEHKLPVAVKGLSAIACSLCLLCWTSWYRWCVMIPFLAMAVCISRKNIKIKVGLFVLFSVFYSFILYNTFDACCLTYEFCSELTPIYETGLSGGIFDIWEWDIRANLLIFIRPVMIAAIGIILLLVNKEEKFQEREFFPIWLSLSADYAYVIFVMLSCYKVIFK